MSNKSTRLVRVKPAFGPAGGWSYLGVLLVSLLAVLASAPDASASIAKKQMDKSVYAMVGGEVVELDQYRAALHADVRNKFYHGKIPKGQLDTFRRHVGHELVTRRLVLHEAKRQGTKPDEKWVSAVASKYEKHNQNSKNWKSQRAQVMPQFRNYLRQVSMLRRFQQQVRHVAAPSESQLKVYYKTHLNKFTEPEQFHVSLILLAVSASAPESSWNAARDEAKTVLKRLHEGADFAKQARLRSSDPSAEHGGDLGYLHKGMLAAPLQAAVTKLKPGQISKPITLLQGVGILRLDSILPAKVRSYASAKDRVRGLWIREQGNRAWQSLVGRLWRTVAIVVNKKYSSWFPIDATTAKTSSIEK